MRAQRQCELSAHKARADHGHAMKGGHLNRLSRLAPWFQRLCDAHHFAHSFEDFDIARVIIRMHADGAQHGVRFSRRAVHIESVGYEPVNYPLNLLLARVLLHYDDHLSLPQFSINGRYRPGFVSFAGAPLLSGAACLRTAARSSDRASSITRSNRRRIAVSSSGPPFMRSTFARISCS